jgi:hypothetical protein
MKIYTDFNNSPTKSAANPNDRSNSNSYERAGINVYSPNVQTNHHELNPNMVRKRYESNDTMSSYDDSNEYHYNSSSDDLLDYNTSNTKYSYYYKTNNSIYVVRDKIKPIPNHGKYHKFKKSDIFLFKNSPEPCYNDDKQINKTINVNICTMNLTNFFRNLCVSTQHFVPTK